MADNYLGEFTPPKNNPYANYTPTDWALEYISCYGQIDGSHHKTWVLDQVAKILHGTPVILKLAKWGPSEDYPDGFQEYRFTTGDPTKKYTQWVKDMHGVYDSEYDEYEYDYDEGIAP